jgi:S1-C subfamily serine protease
VVEGARQLEVETWDGRFVLVGAADAAEDQDLALVRLNQDLPAVAPTGPEPAVGASVTAVGYPGGGPFQQLSGHVVDYVDGVVFGLNSRIMRMTVPVRPGNSGGAVLNERGEMVAVVFAIERRTGYGLAITTGSLERAIASASFYPASSGC